MPPATVPMPPTSRDVYKRQRLEDKLSEEHSFDRIIGSSESLRSAVALARKVAVTDTSVLLIFAGTIP